MKLTTIFKLFLMFIFFTGCTTAKIVNILEPEANDRGFIFVYREPAFNAGGVNLIFGANNDDFVVLKNRDYVNVSLKSGEYELFVRSDQADKPFLLPYVLKHNEKVCLKVYANPANAAKVLLPFTYYLSHTFLAEIVDCTSIDNLSKYREVFVKYSDV